MDGMFIPLVVVSQLAAVVTLVLLSVWTGNILGGFGWDGSQKQFNFHPLFTIMGLVVINGDGMLIYRLFPMCSKTTTKLIHLTLQGLVVVFGGLGLKCVFDFHNAMGYSNMRSLHSWIALPTFLMFGLQWICGFLIFLYPKLSEGDRKNYLPVHRYFGVALFGLVVVAVISGLQEEIGFHPPSGHEFTTLQAIGNSLGISIVIFALLVCYLVTYQRDDHDDGNIDEKQPLTGRDPLRPMSTYELGDTAASATGP